MTAIDHFLQCAVNFNHSQQCANFTNKSPKSMNGNNLKYRYCVSILLRD